MSTAPTIVMAPVPPAIAALLHQLQAQIIKEAEERSASSIGFALHPRLPLVYGSTEELFFRDDKGNEDRFSRRRFCPEAWVGSTTVQWHPSHWRLYRTRVDSEGTRWDPSYGSQIYVTDDFGELVPVEAA